jgi:F0F1-type ATP synthase membrane subunit b/b'
MGLLDTIKGALKGNTDKVKDGLDQAADMVDEKTGGKYSEHIDTAQDKAADMVDDLAEDAAEEAGEA